AYLMDGGEAVLVGQDHRIGHQVSRLVVERPRQGDHAGGGDGEGLVVRAVAGLAVGDHARGDRVTVRVCQLQVGDRGAQSRVLADGRHNGAVLVDVGRLLDVGDRDGQVFDVAHDSGDDPDPHAAGR